MVAEAGILLGIDLGTSAVKVLAVTPHGDVVGRGSAGYDIHWVREGWAEQDPAVWWEATVRAVREALTEAGEDRPGGGAPVAAVGLSGQVNGVVLLDEGGGVLRPALIWLDQRAGVEAEEINRMAADLLPGTALGRASPIHTAAKLRWLLRHEPAVARRAWKALAPKDLLTFRLSGRAVTDVTDAGATLLLDMRRRAWASALIDRLEIPHRLLPFVVESPTVVGEVEREGAEAMGIPEGTPVVAGAGDMAAITAGTGAVVPGLGCIMIGTAGQIALAMAGEPSDAPPGVWAMTSPVPGGYFWHGLVMTAGYCLTWLASLLGGAADGEGSDGVAALAAQAEATPPGSRGLVFLPFLDGAATPHADSQARATFFGATSTHGRADFVRAVMEGVAYNFRDAFETFTSLGQPATRVRIGGGGSRSAWSQILADVLDVDLDLLAEHDASALGAAVIAAVGVGIHPDFAAACEAMVHLRGGMAPHPEHRSVYAEHYAVYRRLYPATRELAHDLGALSLRSAGHAGA